MAKVSDLIQSDLHEIKQHSTTVADSARRQVIVCLLGAALVLVVGVVLIIKSINGMIAQVMQVFHTLAARDLSVRVPPLSGEFGPLGTAVNQFCANLAQTLAGVIVTTDAIASVSEKIATGNRDLANRTGAEADALDATTSAMDAFTNWQPPPGRRFLHPAPENIPPFFHRGRFVPADAQILCAKLCSNACTFKAMIWPAEYCVL